MLLSQPQSMAARWLVKKLYCYWRQRHIGVNDFPTELLGYLIAS